MMKTAKSTSLIRRLAAVLAALCLACMLPVAVFAADTNEAVRSDTSGVVQVKLVYIDPNSRNESNIQSGTGFLINDSTVITCYHVIALDQSTLNMAAEAFGTDANTIKNNSVIRISVLRDMTIDASIKNYSAEMDYAILNLSSQLYDRTYLPIRSSATVQQTEEAYSLGFPGETKYFQDVNTYTSDDVTIASGRVNKINTVGGVDYIQTSTHFTSGNSGGPLVDANGAVIGICQSVTGDNFDKDYFYAVAIDQLTKSLDSLGIDYTKADVSAVSAAAPATTPQESTPVEEPAAAPAPATDKTALSALVTDMQSIEAKDYTDDTADAFSSALSNAQSILANEAATQEQIDAAKDSLNAAFAALEPANSNMLFIILGIVAAVVVVVIVVIVIVVNKKKKGTKPAANEYAYPPAAPAVSAQPQAQNRGFAPASPIPPTTPINYSAGAGETSVLNQGAGETTVLNQGAGETTVLNQNVNYGTLTRKKNNETIRINVPNFVIGKERAKVNYCVADNTSVSRTHAAIHNRGGAAYLADMHATNGTFVNGVRMTAGQETPLKNGDTILLADEEFVYHV